MKFLVDENLPHGFAARLAGAGFADTVHTIHVGLMRKPDHIVFASAVAYDRIIITKNGILADGEREALWALVLAALAYLALQPQPADFMVNRIVEVSVEGRVDTSMMPPD